MRFTDESIRIAAADVKVDTTQVNAASHFSLMTDFVKNLNYMRNCNF
jgi:hypothetical protein